MPKFSLLAADPPWVFADSLTMSDVARGAAANYPTLTVDQLCLLPVAEVVADQALLALWCPSTLLEDGLRVMKAWGFDYKQTWIWVKTSSHDNLLAQALADMKLKTTAIKAVIRGLAGLHIIHPNGRGLAFGMGHLGRNCHEVVLIGTRGRVGSLVDSRRERTVFLAPNLRHSRKPNELQRRLERLIPQGERLELFARRSLANWTTVGDQCPDTLGVDIRDWLGDRIQAMHEEGQ